MLSKLFTIYIKYIFIAMCLWLMLPQSASATDAQGIRIIFKDSEFYFNATNGGEITEYYDLAVDPLRTRNLANISITGKLMGNLWPLFTTGLYQPYKGIDYTTGGDPMAIVELIEYNNNKIIIYTTSRMMNRAGNIVKDYNKNPVYVNTTWIFDKKTGLIFVERTLYIPTILNLSEGWRWYPFYFTRVKGFDYNGTFYMFNTSYSKTVVFNDKNYKNSYDNYPIFPSDPYCVFGIAIPFSNTSIEGDGAHNVIITYNYNELVKVSEWKSDTYNGNKLITECGAVHEYSDPINISTHTYHAVLHFTHKSINVGNVIKYAKYLVSQFPLFEVNITTNNNTYHPGDFYTISASGISHYNLNNLTTKITASNNSGVYFERKYGPQNYTKGEKFSIVLFSGNIPINEPLGNRTFTIQIVSSTGAIIASDSTTISIV